MYICHLKNEKMLEYNTERNKLIIKEYGRNVQKMIEYALTIENNEQRNEAAKAIVKAMSQINSENKDNPNKKRTENTDYWQKLWDHLFIISDYKLDVESPFPKPTPDIHELKSECHSYHKDKIMYRTYGRNMQNIIKKNSECPEETKGELSKLLANHLKKLYLLYNRDSVDDSLIATQLSDLSEGKLQLPEDCTLDTTRDILRQNQGVIQQQNGKSGSAFNPSKNSKKSKKRKKKVPQL